jgi:uncharacterized protein with PIN domain
VPHQSEFVRCHRCRKSPEDIEREDPTRIPSVKYDYQAKKYLCNWCWRDTAPTWGASGR